MPGWPRLARGGSGAPKWGPKNMVLFGNGFEIGDCGISRDPNGLYGTQEAFGKASFPQPPFTKWFPSTFPNLGNLGRVPLDLRVWLSCPPILWSLSYCRGGVGVQETERVPQGSSPGLVAVPSLPTS